jgi:hypothetical protein
MSTVVITVIVMVDFILLGVKVPGFSWNNAPLALVAIGAFRPTLMRFDPASDPGRWRFRTP